MHFKILVKKKILSIEPMKVPRCPPQTRSTNNSFNTNGMWAVITKEDYIEVQSYSHLQYDEWPSSYSYPYLN